MTPPAFLAASCSEHELFQGMKNNMGREVPLAVLDSSRQQWLAGLGHKDCASFFRQGTNLDRVVLKL
jgi:hypothetical protein